jgi:uncharacterized RDD family membrane protein YckC
LLLCHLLYEPLLTWYACTPGQAIMRIRVRSSDTLGRISLDQAIGRVLMKYVCGVLSCFGTAAAGTHRAVHDVLSGTIVVDVLLIAPEHDEHG